MSALPRTSSFTPTWNRAQSRSKYVYTQSMDGVEYEVIDLNVCVAGPSTRAHGGALRTLTVVARKTPYKTVPFIWGNAVSQGMRMDDEKRAIKIHCLDVDPDAEIGLVNKDYDMLICCVKAEGKRSIRWLRKHKELFTEQPTVFLVAVPEFVADSDEEDPEANKPPRKLKRQFIKFLKRKCKYEVVHHKQVCMYLHVPIQEFKYKLRESMRTVTIHTRRHHDFWELLETEDRRDRHDHRRYKKEKEENRRLRRKEKKRQRREERKKHKRNQSVATPGEDQTPQPQTAELKRYHTYHNNVEDYEGEVMELETFMAKEN